MIPQYNNLSPKLLAIRMMLELYQSYDAGGHSSRSAKSMLLESALDLQKLPRLKNRLDREFVRLLPTTITSRRLKSRIVFHPLLFPELKHLSDHEYCGLAIWYAWQEYLHHWTRSPREEDLFVGILLLWDVNGLLEQFKDINLTSEMIVFEGRMRKGRKNKGQDYF